MPWITLPLSHSCVRLVCVLSHILIVQNNYVSIFQPLQGVGRGSGTQLHEGENFKLYYLAP